MRGKFYTLIVLTMFFLGTMLVARNKPTIAIYPMEGKGVSQITVDAFSNELEAQLLALGRYTVVTRKEIEQVIKEQKFQITCSAEACAIELGKILKADIIIGEIARLEENNFHVVVKILETETGRITASISEFPSGRLGNIIKTLPEKIAGELTRQMTAPASLELAMEPLGASILVDGKLIGETPLLYYQVPPGRHTIIVKHPGFETWKESHAFYEAELYSPALDRLSPKTKAKAFRKSLLLPGWGQFYSAEENHRNRAVWGTIYAAITTAGIAGVVGSWMDFREAEKAYENAHAIYLKQKLIEDVNHYREITKGKHKLMVDAEKTAWVFTGITAGVWFWNAIDAVVNFPEYQPSSVSAGIRINVYIKANEPGSYPELSLRVEF